MLVKDIEFTSAQHVIDEIRNMNVKGGSPFGRAAAWAFKFVTQEENLETAEKFIARINDVASQMIELKPTMATIFNTYTIVEKVINNNNDLNKMKKDISNVCDAIIEYSFSSVKILGKKGASLINNGDTVMMHSYSSTLMSIFSEAALKGKKFTVICTESRPLRESINAVRILQKLKIDVIYITDASSYEFIPKSDMIIMGADTLCADGSVANKMGTAMIAKLAKSCKVPVYIASELYKLDLRTQNGYKVQLERRSKEEIIQKNDFENLEGINVVNQFFDLTPSTDIRALICEFGCIPTTLVLSYWEKLLKNILENQYKF